MAYSEDFYITDSNLLAELVIKLRKDSNSLNSLVSAFKDNLTKIDNWWVNDQGHDKLSYIEEVQNCINEISKLASAGMRFADDIGNYQQNTKIISSRNVG